MTERYVLERYVHVVVRAALEDLVSAGVAHGADSSAYRMQLERSMGFIRGSLQEVLQAAHDELSRRARDECRPPT